MKQKRSKLLQFVWGNITMALDYYTQSQCSRNAVCDTMTKHVNKSSQ